GTVTISAQLADANNNPVSTSGQTVTWTKSDANGSFATATSTTNASGIATVVFTTHTVVATATTVTATTSAISGTSASITTVAGTASKYIVTSSSSSPVAGATVTISAQLADANDNPVATSGQTVTWTKSNANGSFASATSTTNASGIATVVFTTHTVVATATTVTATTSAISGTTSTITTVPGAADATASTLTPTSASITANGSSTQVLTVTAKDANGNNVGAGGATVTITKSSGTGTIGSVTDVGNGTYTATVTSPTTVGTGEFIATIGGIHVQNGTGSMQHSVITYTVGPAAKLSFQVQPSNAGALATISPAINVRIEDTHGNLTSSTANVTIDFGTNAGSGTLSGTKTVAAVNGVATFSDLSINNAATGYTLAVSSAGLTGATSNPFNITTSGAAKLAFSVQPSNATAGSSISPSIKVQILDAAGNPTTATDNITLSIDTNPASGTLSGTLTQSAVAGEATFAGISINKSSASSYKLKATSGSLTEAISSTFLISPNTPTTITVTGITPAPGILGINNNIARVNLVDAYGNFSPAPSDIGVELSLFLGATDRTSDGIERTNASNVVQSNPIQVTIPTSSYFTDISYVRYKVSTIDKTTNPYTVNTNATIKATKYTVGGPSLTTGTSAAFTIVEGKIYSPKTTGNWNAVTWAISNDGGTSFADTVGIKYTYNPYDIVKIPTGITTTLSQSVSLYSMIIDGTFDLTTGGTLTLNHHSGIDGGYNVHTHGTFKNSGGTFTNTNESGSSFLPNFHGGTYWHARDGGSIPKALWTTQAAGALTKITGLSSTSLSGGFDQAFLHFEWDNSFSGQTMHGNVSIAKDFYLKSGSFSIGDNNTLTLNETVNGSSGGKLKGTTLSTLHVNTTSGSPTLDFASGGQSLKELKVNVTGGTSLTIPSDLNINNTLNLVAGHVVMGNNKKIILPSDASITGASDTRYVEGSISRVIPKQTDPTVAFPIGDATAYTPVTLDFIGRSAASTDLTIESSTNALPDNTEVNGSGIRGDKYVKRKWQVSDGSGTTSNGFTTYNITLGFPAGDIAGSASLSNMIVRKNSAGWKAPSGHVRADGTTKTVKGQNFNSFSDFYIGESTGATSFTLNSPADIAAGTRAAYIGTRLDAALLPYTTGSLTTYLTSTGSGVFYDAASGGNVITSINFADGSSTVNFWFEKTTAATYTITLSDATPADAGAGITDATDDIAVTVGAVDAAASTLTPTVANITANGTSTQVLSVTAKDAYGNNRGTGGDVVTITKSSGTGSIGSVTHAGSGIYTATVTSPTSTGTGVFVATLGGAQVKSGTGSQTQSTITYIPGAASKYIVTSSSSSPVAGATVTISAQLADANNNPVSTSGQTVTWTKSNANGSFATATSTTNASGIATVVFTTHTVVATATTVTATTSAISGTSASITTVAGTASKYIVTSSSSSPAAGGTVTISAQLADANDNLVATSGQTVTWTKSNANGSFASATSTTNGSGIATVVFTTHTVVATATTVTATTSAISGTSATITTVAGTASKYIVTSSSSSPVAGATVTISAQLADANDNLVATSGQTVTWTKSNANGSFATATSTTNASGIATVVFTTHTVVATATTVTATTSAISGTSATITTVAGTASKYIVTSSSSSPVAGATVTISAQLADANDNLVATSGQTVTWTKSNANGSFATATSTTNASGIATVVFTTHTVVATATTVTATTSAISGTSGTITTVVGAATKYIVTSSNYSPVAGATVIISAQLADANDNPVATSGQTVTWTKSNANGSFATATSTTNASGIATVVFTTHTVVATATTVTATTSAISGTSGTITTVAGAASKYIVTSSSSSPVAGGTVTISAQLADANDNPVATSGQTVTWTKSNANGSFATATSTTNGSGIA
ncbi:beta strand repeat-containing protein, partial [Aquirufa beregesia]